MKRITVPSLVTLLILGMFFILNTMAISSAADLASADIRTLPALKERLESAGRELNARQVRLQLALSIQARQTQGARKICTALVENNLQSDIVLDLACIDIFRENGKFSQFGNTIIDNIIESNKYDLAPILYRYGLSSSGDSSFARRCFTRAIELDPTFAPPYRWLAASGWREGAFKYGSRFLLLASPLDAESLSLTLHHLLKFKTFEIFHTHTYRQDAMNSAWSIAKTLADALAAKGTERTIDESILYMGLLRQLSKYENARQVYEAHVRGKTPKDLALEMGYFWVLRELPDTRTQAAELVRRLAKDYGSNAQVLYELAMIEVESPTDLSPVKLLLQAVAIDPLNVDVYDGLCTVLKDSSEGVESCINGLLLSPPDSDQARRLGSNMLGNSALEIFLQP